MNNKKNETEMVDSYENLTVKQMNQIINLVTLEHSNNDNILQKHYATEFPKNTIQRLLDIETEK